MKTRFFLLLIAFTTVQVSIGQNGGKYVYSFLNHGYAGKLEALGGKHAAYFNALPHYITENPAYTAISEKNSISLSYQNNYADIQQGTFFYNTKSNWTIGLIFAQYGTFTKADEKANRFEKFSAGEYAFVLNYAKKIYPNLSVGMSIKPVLSDFYLYKSVGISSDWGVFYSLEEKHFSAAIVIKNLGVQIKPYILNNYEKLPLEMNVSIAKKLEHAPFALFFSFHNLQTPVLRYEMDNPDLSEYTLAPKLNKLELIGDNILRHFITGIELFPDKNLSVQLGYDYKTRAEMSLASAKGMSGFSMGVSLRKNAFVLEYAIINQHLAGAEHSICLNININENTQKFKKIKQTPNDEN